MSSQGVRKMIHLWLHDDTRKILREIEKIEDERSIDLADISSMVEDLQNEMYGVINED